MPYSWLMEIFIAEIVRYVCRIFLQYVKIYIMAFGNDGVYKLSTIVPLI